MITYKTFLRSARNFEEFANAEKIPFDNGLSEAEARAQCRAWNADRKDHEIEKGTKLEFTEE